MSDSTIAFHNPAFGKKPAFCRFNGGHLTSDSGLLWLSEVDRQLGLSARLAATILDKRQPGKVVHTTQDIIAARIFAIAAGYEDANDLNHLNRDPALQTACGKAIGTKLASQPTISRFENEIKISDVVAMAKELSRIVIEQLPSDSRSVCLDIDASVDPCHGQQQFQYYNGFYKMHCYLPLYLHITGNDGQQRLMSPLLRRGNAGACRGMFGLLRRAILLIRERFPDIDITLRADGAYGVKEVLRFCRRYNLSYILGLRGNITLATETWMTALQVETQCRISGQDQKEFIDFDYKAKSWIATERIVAKVETVNGARNIRYVITDNQSCLPELVYQAYCLRGEQENRIKEMKLDLSAGRTSCHDFLANQFRLLLHAAACVLWRLIQDALIDSKWDKTQIGTLRLMVIKIAAKVIKTTRCLHIQLPTACPHQGLWLYLQKRLLRQPG